MSTEIDLGPLIAALAGLFPDVDPGPQLACVNCDRPEVRAKGLCAECYFRWHHAGRPDHVPPRQRRPHRRSPRREFAEVRALGATVPQAAKHAHIPEHVGWRLDGAA